MISISWFCVAISPPTCFSDVGSLVILACESYTDWALFFLWFAYMRHVSRYLVENLPIYEKARFKRTWMAIAQYSLAQTMCNFVSFWVAFMNGTKVIKYVDGYLKMQIAPWNAYERSWRPIKMLISITTMILWCFYHSRKSLPNWHILNEWDSEISASKSFLHIWKGLRHNCTLFSFWLIPLFQDVESLKIVKRHL